MLKHGYHAEFWFVFVFHLSAHDFSSVKELLVNFWFLRKPILNAE